MFVHKASVWLQAKESGRSDIAVTNRAGWAKRIRVKPGFSLDLKKQRDRSEHLWEKVTAENNCSDTNQMVAEGKSTCSSLCDVRRLFNPGTTPLEIIEGQSGGCLGENDSSSFKDTYDRN